MTTMAVCQAPAELIPGGAAWQELTARTRGLAPDLVLLNEMPFGQWLAALPRREEDALHAAHRIHDSGLTDLAHLGAAAVAGTRPTTRAGRSVNEAFVWTAEHGLKPVHTKQFFPDEAGYYEARWWERGDLQFGVEHVVGLTVGFLICTDVMFLEWARRYGRRGAHLILVPRATPLETTERWKTVMRAAAITSGCYVASSNRAGAGPSGMVFGGQGWIVHPSGEIIATTTDAEPVVSATINVAAVTSAQADYPCYVEDRPA